MARPLFVLGAALLVLTVALALVHGGGNESAPPARSSPSRPSTPPPAPPAAEPSPPPEPQALPAVAPPWRGAGAFVLDETGLDPAALAATLAANGFAWAAIRLHDGLTEDPVEQTWVERYRAAGGPPLGGWGVLRDAPEEEAALAEALLRRHGLGFFVANAEAEYALSAADGQEPARLARSRRYVAAFRERLPELPAALSSFCRADTQDLDWAAWREGGFDFLPQAYVNQHGPDVAPGACVAGARGTFPPARVHPTIGTYPSLHAVTAAEYAAMLAADGAVGFSLYLAETDMTADEWATYGAAARAE